MNMDNLNKLEPIDSRSQSLLSKFTKGFELDWSAFNRSIDENGIELREFGIEECTKSAKEIFTPEVIKKRVTFSPEKKREFCSQYAERVSKAFELVDYKGLVFESLEDGVMGYNRGDGIVHLTNKFLTSPFSSLEMIDTITHELRHQYQYEAMKGKHSISEDVRKEWIQANKDYTTEKPWALDPWGYKYNPLELDARYAGETVVRNLTKDYIVENLV